MKIEDNRKFKEKAFSDILQGTCFVSACVTDDFGDCIYIKTSEDRTHGANAVSLSTGNIAGFSDDCVVTPLNARLVIEEWPEEE